MSEQTIFPTLRYRDAPAAIDWLGRAFGFEPRMVVDGVEGTVAHAELTYDGAMVMLGTARPPESDAYAAATPPPGGGALYLVIADPDAHHERAVAAGADVVRAPQDTDYGAREYTARDLEGNVWSFGTYQPGAGLMPYGSGDYGPSASTAPNFLRTSSPRRAAAMASSAASRG